MSRWDDASNEEGRAPICPYCGVTTLHSGHFRWLDEPEVFFPLVIDWLARV